MPKKLSCGDCNAKCCRYVATEIDKPENKKDYENILWYLLHENVEVFIEDDDWYIQFSTPCKALDKNWECTIYPKRPEICKGLSIENCERNGEGEPYDIVFKEPEDFVEYMKKKGIKINNVSRI